MREAQPKTVAQMVAEARGRTENLTPQQVANEVEAGDATLIDIREGEDRIRNGAIPKSVHAPRGMLEFWADPTSDFHRKEFDPARRTILYCGGGPQSALAADTLQEMGYNVAHLDGGISAWKEEGRSVEEVRPD
jgi:rhodanese-related sulfurtransferase